MVTKAQILSSMQRECDVCVHLHGKIPPGGMDFRLTPAQRSTRELLRYLSHIGIAATRCMVAGSWAPYGPLEARAASLEPADFPAAMARQKAEIAAELERVSEGDLQSKSFTLPWGTTVPLGQALLELAYACLVAYRMQLFLHAKAAGNAAISTANCWGGIDAPVSAATP